MSWDVILSRTNDANESVPLGSQLKVRAAITQVFPEVNCHDPHWLSLDEGDYSIEFNLGQAEPIAHIALHVRGHDTVINAIERLCNATGWHAFDTTTGADIDFNNSPAAGLQRWRSYRDQVFAHLRDNTKPRRRWWQFWQ